MQKVQTNVRHAFDLHERTLAFTQSVRVYVKKLPMTLANRIDSAQTPEIVWLYCSQLRRGQ